jgi:hypothetical protein
MERRVIVVLCDPEGFSVQVFRYRLSISMVADIGTVTDESSSFAGLTLTHLTNHERIRHLKDFLSHVAKIPRWLVHGNKEHEKILQVDLTRI